MRVRGEKVSGSWQDTAKALNDSLPSLDYKKVVDESRRKMGIVVVGDEAPAVQLIGQLRHGDQAPADVKLALWRFQPGTNPPVSLGDTQLVLVVPATQANLAQAKSSFSGVPVLAIALPDTLLPEGLRQDTPKHEKDHDASSREAAEQSVARRIRLDAIDALASEDEKRLALEEERRLLEEETRARKNALEAFDGVTVVDLAGIDGDGVRKSLVAPLVLKLWDRRLAVGRTLPVTRERIAWLLIGSAVQDVRVLLGSLVGAGAGRNGAPTPATAQLLMHQARLILMLAAVYGANLDDRRELFKRVAPHLGPTLALDSVEAVASRIAAGRGGKQAGVVAAAGVRFILSGASTFSAGLLARRFFRGRPSDQHLTEHVGAWVSALGGRVLSSAEQGLSAAGDALSTRLRRRDGALPEAVSQDAPTPQDISVVAAAEMIEEPEPPAPSPDG